MTLRLLPWIAALAAFALFSGLGVWQLQRAGEKADLISKLEGGGPPVAGGLPVGRGALREDAYRRVVVTGRFVADRQFLLDNRILEGRPGFDVLTPLALDDGRVVLVDRGWVPWNARRAPARPIALSHEGAVRVTGRLWLPGPGIGIGAAVAPGDDWPKTVTRVQFPALEKALQHELVPAIVRAIGDAPWLYRPRELRPAFGPARHYGYAFQWFALALTVLVVACILEWRHRRKDRR